MNGLTSTMTATSDACWEAVAARDARSDGAFVYAVRSTKIYCRPVCPSRRPSRANVAFYETPAAAEAAGYRACRRCAPKDGASPLAARSALVAAACARIEASEEPPVLADLAAAAGLSRYHFHRLFTSVTGVTPRAYAAAKRAERLRASLAGAARVADAAYDAGFGSASAFYAGAAASLGMSPSAYRAGGRGTAIRYAIAGTPLGRALVATTAHGICAIHLGDDDAALEAELAARFPHALRAREDAALAGVLASVTAAVAEPARAAALPLDVRGTAFQRRVWQALRTIPAGETRTYAQIAAALEAPRAHRAVASACAANPVAVAIPCHRVQRADGGLGGYRWGLERKRALQRSESQ